MIAAMMRAIGAFRDAEIRRLVWFGVLGALGILVFLVLVLGYLIARLRIVGLDLGSWTSLAEWGAEHDR